MKPAAFFLTMSLVFTGCATVFSRLEISPPFFTGFDHVAVPETHKELDIPRYDDTRGVMAGKPFVYYTYAKQREEQLELEPPELSSHERLLRVWGTFSSHPRRQRGFLAEFIFDDGEWAGRFHDYFIRYDAWKHFERIVDSKSFPLSPEDGWESFETLLRETGLTGLPTDEQVAGLPDWIRRNRVSTASTYSVEYSTPDRCRFFIYQNPHETQKHFDEAARFMRFHDAMFEIIRHSHAIQAEAD